MGCMLPGLVTYTVSDLSNKHWIFIMDCMESLDWYTQGPSLLQHPLWIFLGGLVPSVRLLKHALKIRSGLYRGHGLGKYKYLSFRIKRTFSIQPKKPYQLVCQDKISGKTSYCTSHSSIQRHITFLYFSNCEHPPSLISDQDDQSC